MHVPPIFGSCQGIAERYFCEETLSFVIAAILLSSSIQPKILWSNPDHGVRLGYSLEVRKEGMAEFKGLLENLTDKAIQVRADEPQMAIKPPEIWLMGKNGSFAITPPIVSPLAYDGPDPRVIYLPAKSQVQFHHSRFWIAVPPGIYSVTVHYDSALQHGDKATPISLSTPKSEVDVGEANFSQ